MKNEKLTVWFTADSNKESTNFPQKIKFTSKFDWFCYQEDWEDLAFECAEMYFDNGGYEEKWPMYFFLFVGEYDETPKVKIQVGLEYEPSFFNYERDYHGL